MAVSPFDPSITDDTPGVVLRATGGIGSATDARFSNIQDAIPASFLDTDEDGYITRLRFWDRSAGRIIQLNIDADPDDDNFTSGPQLTDAAEGIGSSNGLVFIFRTSVGNEYSFPISALISLDTTESYRWLSNNIFGSGYEDDFLSLPILPLSFIGEVAAGGCQLVVADGDHENFDFSLSQFVSVPTDVAVSGILHHSVRGSGTPEISVGISPFDSSITDDTPGVIVRTIGGTGIATDARFSNIQDAIPASFLNTAEDGYITRIRFWDRSAGRRLQFNLGVDPDDDNFTRGPQLTDAAEGSGSSNGIVFIFRTSVGNEYSFPISALISLDSTDPYNFTSNDIYGSTYLSSFTDRPVLPLSFIGEVAAGGCQLVVADGDHDNFDFARQRFLASGGTATDVAVSGILHHLVRGSGTPVISSVTSSDVSVSGILHHSVRGSGTPVISSVTSSDVSVSGILHHSVRGSGTPVISYGIRTGGQGVTIEINGIFYEEIERNFRIIKRVGVVSTAHVTMLVKTSTTQVLPTDDDEIIIRDKASNHILFGGNIYKPQIHLFTGAKLIRMTLEANGYGSRLENYELNQDEGIEIAEDTSAGDQAEGLIELLSSEGFTADVDISGEPLNEDFRFQSIRYGLNRLADTYLGALTTNSSKVVKLNARENLVSSGIHLTLKNCLSIDIDTDRQNYRTNQRVIGGNVIQSQILTTDGSAKSWRLGGQSSAPVSLLDDSAIPTSSSGHGVRFKLKQTKSPRYFVLNDSLLDGDHVLASENFGPEITFINSDSVFYVGGSDIVMTSMIITSSGILRIIANSEITPYNTLHVIIRHINTGTTWDFDLANATTITNGLELDLGLAHDEIISIGLEIDGFIVVIVDDSSAGVNISNLTYAPNFQELLVTDIISVTYNDNDQSIGGIDDDWFFSIPRQALVQKDTSSAPVSSDSLIAIYKGQWLATSSSGQIPKIFNTEYHNDIIDPDEGQNVSDAYIERHEFPSQKLVATLMPTAFTHIEEGTGVTVDEDVLTLLRVNNPSSTELWRVDRVENWDKGNLLVYKANLLRFKDESRFREFWNKLLVART